MSEREPNIFEDVNEEIPDPLTEEEAAAETDSMEEETGEAPAEEEEEAGGSAEEAAGEEGKDKKSFFKKKKDKKDIQIEELNDKLRRNMAEFDNFRKRTEKEKASMFDVGAKSVIEKILPIVDNFERGIATRSEEEAGTPFADGMDKVYKQFLSMLEALEVTPIEAVGKEFDPAFHNAVMQDEESDAPENTVVEEFQKGYMYRGSVVRYSMVKVKK
ncbi:MAG: nucleotide exchange factor GrpE [Lachnospiraceae bacterium]|nr:nucleotide exchange factor GrpE [Lachnospiraceae bacterium]